MMNRAASLCWIVLTVSLLGCSDTKQSGAESLGESIGKNVTEFAQGIGTGVDAQMKIKIELAPALEQSGISYTVAKQDTALVDSKKTIAVYFLSTKEFQGELIAKAFNAEGQEIGRATVDVSFKADDAQYISFAFQPEMDRQLVEVYRIDKRS